jgi:gas vesicle protein
MGQGPEELRHDIERRRDDLGDTIDAIGDRVSPGRIIERRRNRIIGGVRSITDRLMGTMSTGTEHVSDVASTVKDHISGDAIKHQTTGAPIGAGLVAFGIGFIVAAAFPATQPEQDLAQRAHDAIEPVTGAIAETGQHLAADLKDDATQAANDIKDTATTAATDVTDNAKHQAAATKHDASTITN